MSADCTEFACVLGELFEKTVIAPFQNEFYKQILASSTGSVVATVCLNPITVVKVKMQTSASSYAASNSLRQIIRNIFVEKGMSGFWSGTPMGIMMSVPNTVVYLATYEEIKIKLNQSVSKESSYRHLVPGLAGGLGRLFAVSVITPLELIRTIQTGGVNKSIAVIGREIVQNRGYRGLYGGWLPSVLRDCPFSAIYWYSFEVLRPHYSSLIEQCRRATETRRRDKDNLISSSTIATTTDGNGDSSGGFSVFSTFLSGASSGMLAALVTHPYDVIKTKQQMAMLQQRPSSAVSLRSLMTEGGAAALYRGLSMRLVSVIPASAIVVTIYEKIKSIQF